MKKRNTITLLTVLLTLTVSFGQQHKDLIKKLEGFENNKMYDTVELEILKATKHILFEPYSVNDKDKTDAIKSVDRWLKYTNNHTFPVMGKLYNSIKNEEHLVLLYKSSMVNYILDQKLNYNRMITCNINPPKGKTYLEQNDVRELHFESAVIFINYLKENNELNQGKDFSKIVASYENKELRKILFEN